METANNDKQWEENGKLFNELIVPHLADIKSLINNYATSRSIKDDMFTVVLENIYRYIHTYDHTKSLKTWIHIVTKRKVIAEEKAHRKTQSHDCDFLIDENMDSASSDYTVSQHPNPLSMKFYKEWLQDDVYDALESLPLHLREPLLYLNNGYTIKEITANQFKKGAITWKSESAIKTRISTAKKRMREFLDKRGFNNINILLDDEN